MTALVRLSIERFGSSSLLACSIDSGLLEVCHHTIAESQKPYISIYSKGSNKPILKTVFTVFIEV